MFRNNYCVPVGILHCNSFFTYPLFSFVRFYKFHWRSLSHIKKGKNLRKKMKGLQDGVVLFSVDVWYFLLLIIFCLYIFLSCLDTFWTPFDFESYLTQSVFMIKYFNIFKYFSITISKTIEPPTSPHTSEIRHLIEWDKCIVQSVNIFSIQISLLNFSLRFTDSFCHIINVYSLSVEQD